MTFDDVQGIIRHFLTTAAGGLVVHGYANQDQTQALVGGAMALIGIAWSLYNKAQHRKALAAASTPSK